MPTVIRDSKTTHKIKKYSTLHNLHFVLGTLQFLHENWQDVVDHVCGEEHLTRKRAIFITDSSEKLRKLVEKDFLEFMHNGIMLKKKLFHCMHCPHGYSTGEDVLLHIEWHEMFCGNTKVSLNKARAVVDHNSIRDTLLPKMSEDLPTTSKNSEYDDVTNTSKSTKIHQSDSINPLQKYETDMDENTYKKVSDNAYLCESCNSSVNDKDAFAHVKEESHVLSFQGKTTESNFLLKENVLFMCILCRSLMETPRQLIQHLTMPFHVQKELNFVGKKFQKHINDCMTKELLEKKDDNVILTRLPIYSYLEKDDDGLLNTETPYLFLEVVSIEGLAPEKRFGCFECTSCGEKLNNNKVLIDHLNSEKHYKKLKVIDGCGELRVAKFQEAPIVERSRYQCDLCKTEMEKDHILKHIYTESHKSRLPTGKTKKLYKNSQNTMFICVSCKMLIQGSESLTKHLLNGNHETNTIVFLRKYINDNLTNEENIRKLRQSTRGLVICTLPCFIHNTSYIVEQPFICISISTDDDITEVSNQKRFTNKTIRFFCRLCNDHEIKESTNAFCNHLLEDSHSQVVRMYCKNFSCARGINICKDVLSSKSLVSHYISWFKGKLYCSICCLFLCESKVAHHIVNTKHVMIRDGMPPEKPVSLKKKTCTLLVNNGMILRETVPRCLYCNCSVEPNALHIEEFEHIRIVQEALKIIDKDREANNLNVNATCVTDIDIDYATAVEEIAIENTETVSADQNVTYKLLLENYMLRYTEKFYCNVCQLPLNNETEAVRHISCTKHVTLRNGITTEESIRILKIITEKDSMIPVNNGLILNGKGLMCLYCKYSVSARRHVLFEHINGKRHRNKVQEVLSDSDKIPKTNVNNLNQFTIHNAYNLEDHEKSIDNGTSEIDDINTYLCETCNLEVNTQDTFVHIKEESHLSFASRKKGNSQLREDILFTCVLCRIVIQESESLIEHLSTVGHKEREYDFLNEKSNGYKEELVRATDYAPLAYPPLSNSLVRRGDSLEIIQLPYLRFDVSNEENCLTYTCLLCSAKLTTTKRLIKHLRRQKHIEKLGILPMSMKVLRTNDDADIPVYRCETCDIEVDKEYVFQHIDTTLHTKNVQVPIENVTPDELSNEILFDCIPCKKLIQGNEVFVKHLVSKEHQANTFDSFRRYILEDLADWHNTDKAYEPGESSKQQLCNFIFPECETGSRQIAEQSLIQIQISGITPIQYLYSRKPVSYSYKYACSLCRSNSFYAGEFIQHIQEKEHNNALTMLCNEYRNPKMYKKLTSSKKSDAKSPIISIDIYDEICNLLERPPFETRKDENPKKPPREINFNQRYLKSYYQLENEMYKCNTEILEQVESSYKISVFDLKKSKVYCIVCQIGVDFPPQKFYDHVRSIIHLTNLKCNQSKYTKQLVKKFPQVNIPTTSKEEPIRIIPAKVFCYACNKDIKENTINDHIKEFQHVKNYKEHYDTAMAMYNSILSKLENCWYSIQKYSCALCGKRYDVKPDFMDHLTRKHFDPLNICKDGIFDFCTWCGTLWLGNRDSYDIHCSTKSHRYLIFKEEFEPRSVSARVKEFLINYNKNAEILFRSTIDASESSNKEYKDISSSLKSILKPLFGAEMEVYFFGSRMGGLGLPNSDIDIYVDCGNYYGTDTHHNSNHLLSTAAAQLNQDKTFVWEILEILHAVRVPIIKLLHRTSGLYCDISFKNGLAVENTKLIKCYNTGYPDCRKLILFLKKWWSVCSLIGTERITNYALTWCVIFYLQQRGILRSVRNLMDQQSFLRDISGWQVCSNYGINVVDIKSDVSFYDLLVGFFEYYAKFDYRHDVISPFMGKLLKKEMFAYPESLPSEMHNMYMRCIRMDSNPVYFGVCSAMCVQDPYDLSSNITKPVKPFVVKCFKHYCQESASFLKNMKR